MATYSLIMGSDTAKTKYYFREEMPVNRQGWGRLRMFCIERFEEFAQDGSRLDTPVMTTQHYDPLVHNAPGINHYMTNLYRARIVNCVEIISEDTTPDGATIKLERLYRTYKLFGIFGNPGCYVILDVED